MYNVALLETPFKLDISICIIETQIGMIINNEHVVKKSCDTVVNIEANCEANGYV